MAGPTSSSDPSPLARSAAAKYGYCLTDSGYHLGRASAAQLSCNLAGSEQMTATREPVYLVASLRFLNLTPFLLAHYGLLWLNLKSLIDH